MHTPETIDTCSLELLVGMLTSRISELERKAFSFPSEYVLCGESDEPLPLTYGPVSFAPTKNAYVFHIEKISASLDQLEPLPDYWKNLNEYIEIIAVAAVRLKAYLMAEDHTIELLLLHRSLEDPKTPEDVKRTLRSDLPLFQLFLRIKQAAEKNEILEPHVFIALDISILQHYAFHCHTKHLGDDHLITLFCS